MFVRIDWFCAQLTLLLKFGLQIQNVKSISTNYSVLLFAIWSASESFAFGMSFSIPFPEICLPTNVRLSVLQLRTIIKLVLVQSAIILTHSNLILINSWLLNLKAYSLKYLPAHLHLQNLTAKTLTPFKLSITNAVSLKIKTSFSFLLSPSTANKT